MPAALPIALGASAAGSLGGSIIGANAAGSAADKQADAAKYASDLQKQIYDQQRSDQQPWRQAGMEALYGQGGLYTRVPGSGGDGSNRVALGDMKTAWVNDQYKKLASQRDAQLAGISGPLADNLRGQLSSQLSDDNLRAQANDAWAASGQGQTQGDGIAPGAYQVDPSLTRSFSVEDFQKDPGYDFRMQEGQKALERSAAARGGLQSGGTLKAINQYGQNFASNEYQNAYNRFTNDQTNRFNRLSSLAGAGQTANSQLSNAGQNYANQVGQNSMGAANAQGAAGIAAANAASAGLGSLGNLGKTWMDYSMANNYLKKNGGQGIF